MARKPSERTHRMKPLEGLNLTPMVDVVTNLMFFLMMFAGLLPVVFIDAPLPKVASTAEEVKQAVDDKNRLELTVWISSRGLVVKSAFGGERSFSVGADGKYPLEEFHKFLAQLHQRRPDAREITLIPNDDTIYDAVIGVMDASRELKEGDTGYRKMTPEIAHKPDEMMKFNRLFPDVSIGGV